MQRSHSVYALLLFILTIALDYAITHKLTPFISMQNHYSLCYREEEREMFPTLEVSARTEQKYAVRDAQRMTRCSASAPHPGVHSARACSRVPSKTRRCAARQTRTPTIFYLRRHLTSSALVALPKLSTSASFRSSSAGTREPSGSTAHRVSHHNLVLAWMSSRRKRALVWRRFQ